MAPKKNIEEEGSNGSTSERCYVHQARLTILENKTTTLEDLVRVVAERTEPLPALCQHVKDLTEQIQSSLTQYQKHTIEEQEKAELVAQERLGLVTITTKLKTRTDVLWYVVIVVLLGAILAKMILPAIIGG